MSIEVTNFDYDMIVGVFAQSFSPGNEQRDYWGSTAAKTPGSRNYSGVSDPVVDEVIETLIQAPNRQQLEVTARALDRILLAKQLVIPMFNKGAVRVAHWDVFGHPTVTPDKGFDLNLWWIDPAKYSKIRP